MAKVLRCRDVGVDCDFVAKGETEEDILQQALKSTDALVKKTADDVMKNRAKAQPVPVGV